MSKWRYLQLTVEADPDVVSSVNNTFLDLPHEVRVALFFDPSQSEEQIWFERDYLEVLSILDALNWELVSERSVTSDLFVATFRRQLPSSTLNLFALLIELLEVGPAPDHEKKLRQLHSDELISDVDLTYLLERLEKKCSQKKPNFGQSYDKLHGQ